MPNTMSAQDPRRKWVLTMLTLLVLGTSLASAVFLWHMNTSLKNMLASFQAYSVASLSVDEASCDMSSLCLQESTNEGGVFGIAEITAHFVGDMTVGDGTDSDRSGTCPAMQLDSANDLRAQVEILETSFAGDTFVISETDAERFAETTVDSPVTLLVYISERVGRETGVCYQNVHILN